MWLLLLLLLSTVANAQIDSSKCVRTLAFLDAGAFNQNVELGGDVCAGEAAWVMLRLTGFIGLYFPCAPYQVTRLEFSGVSESGVVYSSGNILPTPTWVQPWEQRDQFWPLLTKKLDTGLVPLLATARVTFQPTLTYPREQTMTLRQEDAFFNIVPCQ